MGEKCRGLSLRDEFRSSQWCIRRIREFVSDMREARGFEGGPDEDNEVYKFLLMREPNEDAIRFLNVPAAAFDEEEEEDDVDEEEGEGGEEDEAATGGGRMR